MEFTPKSAKCQPAQRSPCSSAESSPFGDNEGKHHPKLSASLKERLKRSRRSFISPLSVAKRLCVDDLEEEENGRQVSADSHRQAVNSPPTAVRGVDVNSNEGSESLAGHMPETTHLTPEEFAQQLRKEVKDKMETLRRLKMVKMYRSKNDLTQLETLIKKWRSCAQAALYELQSQVPIDGRKADLSELIDLFNLDDGILHFDRTEEDFTA
ncbi:swi5-dependent recombination DNA repair protein 1 homolog [Salarias fasciatus]|uniref:Swi5-dependent recombination DNA repair protein 1 homolog n=1 Tax=Salarias fasciatus TaxID=181472 RepID=A0A672J7J3_SALFA|nr:swi5-dependent recombination DNA repair protein 1 homolog [Salarias fasciatus]